MNYAVRNDIKHAINLKVSTSKKYSKYSKLYSFTTENIKGYFKYIDFNNKDVLTVSSSGDHIINAILNGANIVESFDINKLSYYYCELKYAAIKALSYEEFISYFTISDNTFKYEIFLKLKDNLPNNIFIFFDKLYRHFDYNGEKFRTSKIFNNLYDIKVNKISYNEYLEKDKYYEVQKKINSIKFICSSFTEIVKCVDKKYDIILLSNISDYINNIFKDDYLEKYKFFIENELSKLLNNNGIIVLGYIYNYNLKNKGRSEIDNERMRNKIFNSKNYQIYTFASAISRSKRDAVIIYRKEE